MNKSKTIAVLVALCGVLTLSSFLIKQEKQRIYIIGDSTVRNGQGNGSNGQWGWGSFLADYIDNEAVEVYNKALGGTSSRTYFTNRSLWQTILDSLRPGDIVLMQFGHNDSSPVVDSTRARGTIPGNSNDYQEVNNPLLKQKEMVYSYGFYLRQFVKNIQNRGARAIICSPIPRNKWEAGEVVRSEYAKWAEEAATQSSAEFIPLQDLVIAAYQQQGKDYVSKHYFDAKDATHTLKEGAVLNAKLIAEYFSNKPELGLAQWIKK
ncbi:SGNH/GDSL hydrolase family protein [Sphingobacterium sp. BN32]|uniref:SGNH/GDSL hydrolase family protein n=1 Tax=Sphingobacterium sp. BN32 TaxID=3058432 RepID=UPI00265CD63F|nr:SGNH/GDSL hydrolase family protein [Sphingobacterium sp. BN32]WKK59479.1 GDSL-type esterase/lipase family protein [Sphingobacterium sp. BN32]